MTIVLSGTFAPAAGLLALLAFGALGVPAGGQGSLAAGPVRVEVSEQGLLTSVSEGALAVESGAQTLLLGQVAEWASVAWRRGDGALAEAAAVAAAPDWAPRPSLEPVAFSIGAAGALAVQRHGPLQVETHLAFDAGGTLLGTVTLRNLGEAVLAEIVYTREWGEEGRAGSSTGSKVQGLRPIRRGVHRAVWAVPHLSPGGAHQVRFRYRPVLTPHAGVVDVPLSLWTSPLWLFGFVFPGTNGVSWGDANNDGWMDLLVVGGGKIWINDQGQGWIVPGIDLNTALPPTTLRYGGSWCDYDNDGDQDFGTEPRNKPGGDSSFHLMMQGVTGAFVDVAGSPFLFDVQPTNADSETICWGDVDGDQDLDMFLPVYPPWSAIPSVGNFFLRNNGPVGPVGLTTFSEVAVAAGLDNPPGTARPEGAQFCDVDSDGDLDLWSNMTLYRNVSTLGAPAFEVMTTAAIGVDGIGHLDEGAAFFDYDLDGDFDLVIAHIEPAFGVRVWESRGDGTFFLATGVVESPTTGLGLGLSYADWDNDGDVDLTTRYEFRRNQFIETGQRKFTVASHSINSLYISEATPGWCDWDRDGDLDAAMGNYFQDGRFFENTLYDEATPPEGRRYVRVRPVRDWTGIDSGLDNEYGAAVEVHVAGEEGGPRRRAFTASGHGYLNQNEYTVHLALPADPAPADPLTDVQFDVSVDFPMLDSQGIWRVDHHVNPALGGIDLATLTDREIVVYRSGRVLLDGVDLPPADSVTPQLITSGGGLAQPATGVALAAPAALPASTWVGIELDTHPAEQPQRMVELVLDGRLDAAVPCGGETANVALFEVTDPASPQLVPGGALVCSTDPRNDRSSLRLDLELLPGRRYRLMARVTARRTTPIAGPVNHGSLVLLGGLEVQAAGACDAAAVAGAAVDPAAVSLAVRFREQPAVWVDLGNGLAGTYGVPLLSGSGTPAQGSQISIALTGCLENAPVVLVYGTSAVYLPIIGAVLVPLPEVALSGLATDATGALSVGGTWTAPAGAALWLQGAVIDPAAPQGLAVTNGLLGLGQEP